MTRVGGRIVVLATLSEEEVCGIVRIKQRHRHWGAAKIREVYLAPAWASAEREQF